jgi:hypothetical protein
MGTLLLQVRVSSFVHVERMGRMLTKQYTNRNTTLVGQSFEDRSFDL